MFKRLGLTFLILGINTKAYAFLPKSFEAQVGQEQKSALSGKIKKSQGVLLYRYPGHMRFEIKTPDEVVFVSNPLKTWYYTAPFIEGESGELNISDKGDHILTKFFDSFAKGLKSNDLYTVESQKDGARITFNDELKKELGVTTAEFSFKDKNKKFESLDKIQINQKDGREIVLSLDEIKTNQNLPDERFVFEVPENTKVIK